MTTRAAVDESPPEDVPGTIRSRVLGHLHDPRAGPPGHRWRPTPLVRRPGGLGWGAVGALVEALVFWAALRGLIS